MANEQNLRPGEYKLSVEEAKKGGINSGIARRKRKTLAQIGDMIGSLDIKSEKNRDILRQAGISDEDMINDVGMMFRLNLKAQNGDTRAIELLSKLRGELNSDSFLAGASVESVTINFSNSKASKESK